MCPLMAIGLGVLVTGDHVDARMLFGTAIALARVLLILLKPRKAAHLLSTDSVRWCNARDGWKVCA
jgi:O-acetylserine/cysteine efflux transporter